jgi:hypothetical protein
VAALTEVLFAGGGNLEDASKHRLSGQFAMTLVVNVDAGLHRRRRPAAHHRGARIRARPGSAVPDHLDGLLFLDRVAGSCAVHPRKRYL